MEHVKLQTTAIRNVLYTSGSTSITSILTTAIHIVVHTYIPVSTAILPTF
jgi:hypothetical protein